jgi:hypothetical protein
VQWDVITLGSFIFVSYVMCTVGRYDVQVDDNSLWCGFLSLVLRLYALNVFHSHILFHGGHFGIDCSLCSVSSAKFPFLNI